jgi:hypothetical protein
MIEPGAAAQDAAGRARIIGLARMQAQATARPRTFKSRKIVDQNGRMIGRGRT